MKGANKSNDSALSDPRLFPAPIYQQKVPDKLKEKMSLWCGYGYGFNIIYFFQICKCKMVINDVSSNGRQMWLEVRQMSWYFHAAAHIFDSSGQSGLMSPHRKVGAEVRCRNISYFDHVCGCWHRHASTQILFFRSQNYDIGANYVQHNFAILCPTCL